MKRKSLFSEIIILLIFLINLQMVRGQTRESCMSYDSLRTLDQFKELILTGKDPFIQKELWPAYAEIANAILQTSKLERVRDLRLLPDESCMKWLMDHSVRYESSYFKQSDYLNGVRINDKLNYQDVLGQESDYVVLSYEDITPENGMFAKIKCTNPEKRKKPLIPYTFTSQPEIASTTPFVNNVTVNVTINMDSLVRSYIPPKEIDLGFTKEDESGKFHISQKWWFWTILGGVTQTAVGFVAHDEDHAWYFWFPENGNQQSSEGNPVDAPPQGK